MMKQMAIVARRPDMTVDAFRAHWSTAHAALVARRPALVRYVQNDVLRHVPRPHLPEAAGAIDGIEELWFAADADRDEAERSPACLAVRSGEISFLGGKTVVAVEEIVVYDRAAEAAAPRDKRLSLLRRKAAMSPAAFRSYWSTAHRDLAVAHRHADRYVQNHVLAALPCPELPQALAEIDGIGEFETADFARMQASYARPSGQALNEDSRRFLDAVSTYLVRAREIALPAGD